MPSSHLYQIQTIIELMLFTNPSSILDVGIGFGKYGFLAREYLELWNTDQPYGKWTRRIDGIEAFPDYITPAHRFIYNNIYVGNAVEAIASLDTHYDLLLLIDVVEHFEYKEGIELLRLCKDRSRNVLVSTPKDMGKQESLFGNPHEQHKFQWTMQHFGKGPDVCFLDNDYSLLCYSGEYAQRLKRARINRAVGRAAPFLIPMVKRIKGLLK